MDFELFFPILYWKEEPNECQEQQYFPTHVMNI